MEFLEQGNVYALPDGTIIRVNHDYDASCPMGDADIPVYAYREPRLSATRYSDEPEDDVLRTFAEFFYRTGDSHRSAELTKRYYRTYFNNEAQHLRLGSWVGYFQGDWLDYAYVSEYDESKEFGLYLQGDISVVSVDYPNGGFESLSGIYGEYGSVSADDMFAYFGLDISHAREAVRTTTYTYPEN